MLGDAVTVGCCWLPSCGGAAGGCWGVQVCTWRQPPPRGGHLWVLLCWSGAAPSHLVQPLMSQPGRGVWGWHWVGGGGFWGQCWCWWWLWHGVLGLGGWQCCSSALAELLSLHGGARTCPVPKPPGVGRAGGHHSGWAPPCCWGLPWVVVDSGGAPWGRWQRAQWAAAPARGCPSPRRSHGGGCGGCPPPGWGAMGTGGFAVAVLPAVWPHGPSPPARPRSGGSNVHLCPLGGARHHHHPHGCQKGTGC